MLPKLADSFAHTENAALKTWVATTLFGRGGMALIPLLNRGGNAIREYAREAEQLGYVFTKEDNENLEAYHHSMIRLDTAVQGFIGLVGSELAPVLRPIVDDMALWIRANRDWIATGITGSVKDLSDFLKQQDWAGAGRDLGSLASGAGQVVTQLGGLKTVVEGLVLLKVAGWVWELARGFVAMAAGLDAIAGSAIFAPAAVAALAAVAAAIGTMATANVLGRIRYGDTLEHLRDEHEHPLKYPGYRSLDGPAFGPYSATDPMHPFKGIETPAMREFRLQGERTRESAAAHDEAQRRIAEEEAERERQRHPPPFDPGPVYPPGFPGGFIQFPSPFPDRSAGGLGLGRGGVDGQLRILLEIPNLPEGAKVTTETFRQRAGAPGRCRPRQSAGRLLMSGILDSVSGALNSSVGQAITGPLGGLPDFLAGFAHVRPASFRGVPFVVDSADGDGGRRIVTHEFPLRDKPFTEDLGRAAQRHRIRAFVIGDDYQDKRDALLKACQDADTVGTLVHPWLGNRQVRAGRLRWTESKDRGGYAAFDIEFIEAGDQASPLSVWDTAGTVLHALLKIVPIIKRAYAIASLASKRPGYLGGFLMSLGGQIGEGLLGLPPATLTGLRSTIAGMSGAFGDDSTAADAVNNTFQGAAVNVINRLAPPVPPDDGISLRVPMAPSGGDLTGGLLPLTGWGSVLPTIIPATPHLADMAAQQAAVVGLVHGAATVAVLEVYAAVDWPSAQAASAALTQVLSLIDARTAAAADAGLDDLFFAWQAIGAMAVEDVTRRAAQAPSLARYSLPDTLSSLALAQLLYGDAGRAEELEALNDAIHPAFMPRSGFRLAP